MGHERIGFLPRTKAWKAIIDQLATFDDSDESLAQIANATLNNVKKTYESMPYDESVIKALQYLVTLSVSAKKENQVNFLQEHGYIVDENLSLLSLVRSAKNLITTENGSLESNKMVRDAILQAITAYERNNRDDQLSLFREQPSNIWSNIGSGAAFCELTRSFFAAFTDRYLRYYLEREAASIINDYRSIEAFSQKLSEQAEAISHHAFETSKIMQSFAAGWYNRHAKDSVPSTQEITDFLRLSFGKMREEFRREADEL